MVKRLSLISVLFLAIFSLPSCSDDDGISDSYYRNGEEKVGLKPVEDKFYIAFRAEDEAEIESALADVGLSMMILNQGKTFSFLERDEDGKSYSGEYKDAYLDGDYRLIKEVLNRTFYWSCRYTLVDEKHTTDVAPTFQFYGVPKDGVDVDELKKFAERNNVVFLGDSSLSPLNGAFLFACTRQSKGNSVEMVNLLYDSGLCRDAAPFMFGTAWPLN